MTTEISIRSRAGEIRKARGLSAAHLAEQIGVSRQTIYAIEDGTFVPNTAVSLEMARALDVTVEQLFAIAENEPSGARGRKKKPFLIAGCDPALSLIAESLRSSGVGIEIVPANSRRALKWLKQGKVHAAGSHLRDRSTGDYNLPVIRRVLPDAAPRVVTFALWEEGLAVLHGNPKRIKSFADLGRRDVSIVNREEGAGSRELLDEGLRKAGISAKNVKGYESRAKDHFAAAHAVEGGAADCCVVPRSAARCFGLDFIPLAVERFDLSFTRESAAMPAGKAVIELLKRSQLRRKLEAIPGYDASHTGEVLV